MLPPCLVSTSSADHPLRGTHCTSRFPGRQSIALMDSDHICRYHPPPEIDPRGRLRSGLRALRSPKRRQSAPSRKGHTAPSQQRLGTFHLGKLSTPERMCHLNHRERVPPNKACSLPCQWYPGNGRGCILHRARCPGQRRDCPPCTVHTSPLRGNFLRAPLRKANKSRHLHRHNQCVGSQKRTCNRRTCMCFAQSHPGMSPAHMAAP